MASITPNNGRPSPQTVSILNTIPFPRVGVATAGNIVDPFHVQFGGAHAAANNGAVSPGVAGGGGVLVGGPEVPASVLYPSSTALGGGLAVPLATVTSPDGSSAVIGGGGPLPNGAQPAAPNGQVLVGGAPGVPAAPATTPPTTASPVGEAVGTGTAAPTGPSPAVARDGNATGGRIITEAAALSGFSRAQLGQTMKGGYKGATFSFPAYNNTKHQLHAPKVTWGPGWKRVNTPNGYYMEHKNGAQAVPTIEYRMTPSPVIKATTVALPNAWGKKLPDGTIIGIDKKTGPFRIDPKGKRHPIKLGTFKYGGVQIRLFEASIVRIIEPNGGVTKFDSRANVVKGTPIRKGGAAAVIAGGGSVHQVGQTGGGPGASASLVSQVQKLTEVARGVLTQVQSGNMDSSVLASMMTELTALAGTLQAAGAGTLVGSDTGTPPASGSGGGAGNIDAGLGATTTHNANIAPTSIGRFQGNGRQPGSSIPAPRPVPETSPAAGGGGGTPTHTVPPPAPVITNSNTAAHNHDHDDMAGMDMGGMGGMNM